MAFIDYGVIAFKNGKIITKDTYFNDMKEMVGWEDDSTHPTFVDGIGAASKYPENLKGMYFCYIGDKEFTVAFYKNIFAIYYNNYYNSGERLEKYYLNDTNYTWSKWKTTAWLGFTEFIDIVITKRNGYLVCKMNYKGDDYKVYFGYGVDLDCYKKYHIVNYYRTPWFLVKDFFRDMEYRIKKR